MVTNFSLMTITVNNNTQIIKDLSSIRDLLKHLSIFDKGIAVAQNNHIISREHWDTTHIQDNDTITIIQATQGG